MVRRAAGHTGETAGVRILAFDTSGGACSAAVWRDGAIAGHRHVAMDRGHTEALMPMVIETLHDSGCAFDELDWLAVTIGPGSFTGIRAGLAAARGIALARALPVLGIDSFATVLSGIGRAVPDEARRPDHRLRVIALDSRRKEVYLRIFSPLGEPLTEPDLVAPDDAALRIGAMRTGGRAIVLAGSAAKELASALRGAGLDILAVPGHEAPDAGDLARLAAIRIAARKSGEALPRLAPLYLHPPYAHPPAGGGRLRP